MNTSFVGVALYHFALLATMYILSVYFMKKGIL
ncbi:MAG: hypothetical protein PWQ82_138 [Thermosediminibacterales bacterium]|nr:hypothetical protein [Thermosediminibacterales bacterium]MDK2835303.1 hypothetical protein [Thermosediminibacterales bacterium]